MSDSPLRRSPRLSHNVIQEHAEAIKKEIQNESFMNEETGTIYFNKYYRTILQHVYESVVMNPYNTNERLSEQNHTPRPLTPEEMQNKIKSNFVPIFKYITDLLIPIIQDHRLKFKMLDGRTIIGTYYESRFNFPESTPDRNDTLPIRIRGLEFGVDMEVIERIYNSYRGYRSVLKRVKRTLPMYEIDTIQILPQQAGKRNTRKKTKRTKQTRRRK